MHCRIHVRYSGNVDAADVIGCVLALWDGTRRPRLSVIPDAGRPVPATQATVEAALDLAPDGVASVTIRHRRRNKDTDSVRFRFGKPGQDPGIYEEGTCHVCFYHDRIEKAEPGYAPADLVEIMAGLIEAGPVAEAYSFGGDPFEAGDFRELSKRAERVDTGSGILRSLWWLTFVPEARVAPTVAELDRLGIEHATPRTLHARGSILSLSPRYPGDSALFHETLRKVRQLSPGEQRRAVLLDLETIPVFRLAGRDLEVKPFAFQAVPTAGSDTGTRSGKLAESFATGNPGGAWDFSRASLETLAGFLVDLKQRGPEASHGVPESTLAAAGAYFGEVLRRHSTTPWHWVERDDWVRAQPALAARIRGPRRSQPVLVSDSTAVILPVDRVFEVLSPSP